MKKKVLALSVLAVISSQANAFRFDTGDDWAIRWDNTIKANAMVRVAKQDRDVYAGPGLNAQLQDDADLSVDRGDFISQRLDVLSELDVIWRDDFGFRISGSAWYDHAYSSKSDNRRKGALQNGFPAPDSTWNAVTADVGEYTDAAEDLHYKGGELLDAFVFANWDMGDMAAGIRAGRHTLYWGQSLLTTGAIIGIAGGMASIDIAKGWSVPGTEVKELFMPTNKISGILQVTDNLTLNAFYAFEHAVNRFPEPGTYFSPVELLTEDSEFLTFTPGGVDTPRAGFKARNDKYNDSGEWGVNVQYTFDSLGGLEASFVYINSTGRNPSGLYASQGGIPDDNFNKWLTEANAAVIGSYGWVYKSDIDTYGISLSKQMFDISFGMDIVYREDAEIAPELAASLLGELGKPPSTWNGDDSPGPTGDVTSVVVNGLGFLNGEWGIWDGGTYIVEVTAAMLNSYGDNPGKASVKVHEDRVVTNIAARFNPTWYQVFPGWDMVLPMSVAYTIDGENSPLSSGGQEEIGNASVGVEFRINEQWNWSTKYNNFFGPANDGIAGRLKDRDNISMTLKRTF